MTKQRWTYIGVILAVVLLNVVAHCWVVRRDMTDDKRYSLHDASRELVHGMQEPIECTLYLSGELNPGFTRLREATSDWLEELSVEAHSLAIREGNSEEAEKLGLSPILVHERQKDGRTAQTPVYPYLRVQYGGRNMVVKLLQNQRGLSGEENLNHSIENLEWEIADALRVLSQTQVEKIAFLEGHGELPEANVWDVTEALSRYFQVDRGVLGNDANVLNDYRAVIIADPQSAFSETDKYILDQYIQQGGNILWCVNGVKFSQDILGANGFTPVIANDLNLTDMWFRYGVRLSPALLQDRQCLPIPVDVSREGEEPNYQPLPWYYAPLLLTSQASPVTKGLTQVSSMFVSPIEAVGGDDGLRKEVLLATSSASRVISTPAEVDLGLIEIEADDFPYGFLPVGVSVEGEFASVFAHRMPPEGVVTKTMTKTETKTGARQVFIGTGSVIRNEVQQGQPLPAGYDRYSRMQFGNRDFIVNLVLWLTDDEGLIALRGREVTLRLVNEQRAQAERVKIQMVSTLVPVGVLALIGLVVGIMRRRKYC